MNDKKDQETALKIKELNEKLLKEAQVIKDLSYTLDRITAKRLTQPCYELSKGILKNTKEIESILLDIRLLEIKDYNIPEF